jgi:hypothetical protein
MAVTARNYSSVAVTTTLSSGINSSVTAFNVAASTGWPAAPFIAVLDPNTVNEEIILVGAAAGTSWSSITRGYDSSAAVSHNAGGAVQHMVVGVDFREAQNHAVSTTSNVHSLGVGSVVVGTTDSQTLTNKTLTSPTLNSPVLTNAGGAATLSLPSTTDTLVGRATTDTLTNKTLTSPAISAPAFSGTPTGSLTNLALTTPAITGSAGALTLPAGPDVLVGRSTTDTLYNKSLSAPVVSSPVFSGTASGSLTNLALTTPAITGSGGALTLPAGPTTILGASTAPSGNLLDNPSFRIDQRSGWFGPALTNADVTSRNNHVVDRWRYANNGTTLGSFWPIVNSGGGIPTPSGWLTYWSVTTNNASMAQLQQRSNELFLSVNNKTVTFSMTGASAYSIKLNITYTVNYGTGGTPSASQVFTIGSVTVPATLVSTRVSTTATIPDYLVGKTLGTNSDAFGQLNIEWDQTNANAAQLNMDAVQLEVGSIATPFVQRPLQQDLAQCLRHLYILGGGPQLTGTSFYMPFYQSTSTIIRSDIVFPVPMRRTPTLSTPINSNAQAAPASNTQFGAYLNGYNTTIVFGAWSLSSPRMLGLANFSNNAGWNNSISGATLNLTHTGAGFTVGLTGMFVVTDQAYFAFSAEL